MSSFTTRQTISPKEGKMKKPFIVGVAMLVALVAIVILVDHVFAPVLCGVLGTYSIFLVPLALLIGAIILLCGRRVH